MNESQDGQRFQPVDDALHDPGDDFYHTETFWFSFFVPDRAMGAWLYSGVRQNAGVSTGGLWVWDPSGTAPWESPFYENFSWLKPPAETGPGRIALPNGGTITTIEPGMVYDLAYDDRDRVQVRLRFAGLEQPVPLLAGTPPYPTASHYDQTGRVTGHMVLDGEHIEVDCHAMRDRSWGTRKERGRGAMAYTWLAGAEQSLLVYTRYTRHGDEVYAGYLRRAGQTHRVVSGTRSVRREPGHGWITTIELDVTDTAGRRCAASGEAVSRLILPGSTGVCVNSALRWTVDGVPVHGEDQEVRRMQSWRTLSGRG